MARKEAGPDQARSWAIAMAGFVINSLLSGISRTTGLFYVALIKTYGVSRMEANMPFTLRNVIRNLGGMNQLLREMNLTKSNFLSLCPNLRGWHWHTTLWDRLLTYSLNFIGRCLHIFKGKKAHSERSMQLFAGVMHIQTKRVLGLMITVTTVYLGNTDNMILGIWFKAQARINHKK